MLFKSKIGLEDILSAYLKARKTFPDREVVLIRDQLTPAVPLGLQEVDVSTGAVEDLDRFAYGQCVFLYASDQDDLGVNFIRRIVQNRGKFLPAESAHPAAYVNVDRFARRVLEEEFVAQSEARFAKWDFGPGDFLNLTQVLSMTAGLEGDYVEVGTYEGSSAGVALSYMRSRGLKRRCYFIDVFDGFNYAAARESADALWQDSHETSGVERVIERLQKYVEGYDDLGLNVLRSNIITDDLPSDVVRVAAANVDVDMYEAVLFSLRKLAPVMVGGGVIVVEDPGHTPYTIGARLALEEFLEDSIAAKFIPVYMESAQTLLIRLQD